MKTRIWAFLLAACMLCMVFSGCAGDGQPGKTPGNTSNEAQFAVALNPVLAYDSDDAVIAYNTVNAAMRTDHEASSLTAMQDTGWHWMFRAAAGWEERPTYALDKWQSGAGKTAKKVYAYTYTESGRTSLSRYAAQTTELTPYQSETVPQSGLLCSGVGTQEEALSYVVEKDGVLTIPEGTVTAIAAVAGIKTGFLAEDGTARSASVRLMINDTQLWSGTLCNATAAADGTAVTQLSYPTMKNLSVKAGDVVFFAFQLNAQANRDADVSAPGDNGGWALVRKSRLVPAGTTSENTSKTDVVRDDGSISMITDYMSTFTLVRDPDDAVLVSMVSNMATVMMDHFGAVISVASRTADEAEYEIVVGAYAVRPQSVALTQELQNARADNASDYRIRLIGKKVYIVAANNEALQAAVEYFLEKFGSDDDAAIPADYDYYYQPAHKVYMLAGRNIASYTIRTERYPSLVVQKAAEALRQLVQDDCGYRMEIRPMNNAGTDAGSNEIRLGPMNGRVGVTRTYDTRFTNKNESAYMSIEADGYPDWPESRYEAKAQGDCYVVSGGSSYAVNAAVSALLTQLKQSGAVTADQVIAGDYVSAYAVKTKFSNVKYDLCGGYGMVIADEFSYTGTDEEIEKQVKSRWSVSVDEAAGPPSKTPGEEPPRQKRAGIYGDTWWITQDGTGNGYLQQITKAESYGYDAGRLISQYKWGFRYGIWETRLVMATRNGACSSLWAMTEFPVIYTTDRLEIDLYENKGQDAYAGHLIHWSKAADGRDQFHIFDDYGDGGFTNIIVSPEENEHFYDTFHHMALEWTPTSMTLYLDGRQTSTMNTMGYNVFLNGVAIKLANGVGTTFDNGQSYTAVRGKDGVMRTYDPDDFMEDVSKFFEVQTVDYTRVFQTANDGKSTNEASRFWMANSFGKVK